ncbi:hypothetical protein BK662_02950 [Pseudomonas frederiksbergensis]|uniref:Uncharacterized protein n=1 Tax=Pseudomonas frederiksbergensis TaxID=104087 RepID=A0A423I1C9_9PSED|nr:hypothetical protein BK662_02950 [Pseudomonas frederiksbergensis]
MAEKRGWIRWKFTPMHRREVVLKRMAEAIAGDLKIDFGLGNHRKMLGELDEPSQGLEGSQIRQQPIKQVAFGSEDQRQAQREKTLTDQHWNQLALAGAIECTTPATPVPGTALAAGERPNVGFGRFQPFVTGRNRPRVCKNASPKLKCARLR